MTPETNTTPIKLCPTCGTRVKEDATRCMVCGADLTAIEKPAQSSRVVQGSRMPSITMSLPALFLGIGAIMVYFALRQKPEAIIPPTQTSTSTVTATSTQTATQTLL